MDLPVKDSSGKVVGSVEASDYVWAEPSNMALLHQVVVAQLSNKRRGTQDTVTRGESGYSTAKLRAQKHTGRARLGSRSSPAMRGSVAHGPHPRSYRKRLPVKMRRKALRIALSDKVRDDVLIVLDQLRLDAPSTRAVKDVVTGLGLQGRTLIITGGQDPVVVKSASNLDGIEVLPAQQLNPLDATSATNLIVTQEAVGVIEGLWGIKAGGAA